MTSNSSVRIVIADDHAIFRAALRKLIESEPGFRVTGEAADGAEAVKLTRQLHPDVLLLDLAIPRLPGLEALRKLSPLTRSCRVIVLTAHIENAQLIEALRIGACGIILKNSAVGLLFQGIRTVMAGDYWVGSKRVVDPADSVSPAAGAESRQRNRTFGLTSREVEVVRAVAAGCTNKDIARRLAISQDTIKHHLSNIFDKLGVSNRLELALFAYHHRLADATVPVTGSRESSGHGRNPIH